MMTPTYSLVVSIFFSIIPVLPRLCPSNSIAVSVFFSIIPIEPLMFPGHYLGKGGDLLHVLRRWPFVSELRRQAAFSLRYAT